MEEQEPFEGVKVVREFVSLDDGQVFPVADIFAGIMFEQYDGTGSWVGTLENNLSSSALAMVFVEKLDTHPDMSAEALYRLGVAIFKTFENPDDWQTRKLSRAHRRAYEFFVLTVRQLLAFQQRDIHETPKKQKPQTSIAGYLARKASKKVKRLGDRVKLSSNRRQGDHDTDQKKDDQLQPSKDRDSATAALDAEREKIAQVLARRGDAS